MLNALRRRSERRRLADAVVAALVVQARQPVFFERYGVADSIDGRFDLVALHAWLVLERLAGQGAQALSQAVVDGLFEQFDDALRQQGAGDMGMSRRMSKMAEAFYGRLKAYGEAPDRQALAAALLRNVFRGNTEHLERAEALAIYTETARARLAAADCAAGEVAFA